jgi:hypothetical protein
VGLLQVLLTHFPEERIRCAAVRLYKLSQNAQRAFIDPSAIAHVQISHNSKLTRPDQSTVKIPFESVIMNAHLKRFTHPLHVSNTS